MTTIEVPYKVLVGVQNGTPVPIDSHDFSTTSADIRQQWIDHIIEDMRPGRSGLEVIRAVDILLNPDGTAGVTVEPTLSNDEYNYGYPAPFRIPPATIEDLPSGERARRAEMFALGSLLYNVYSGHKPFDTLAEMYVEVHFADASFPDDVLDLDTWPMILSSWSLEFALELHKTSLQSRLHNYVKSHPYLTALQACGALVGAVALSAPLILGAVGFGVAGPVAGSVAAGWQSSIGLVQTGSFFAWCQSAAMGGAAAGGITAAGVAGASTAAGATVFGSVTKKTVGNMTEAQVREMYERAFRRGPNVQEFLEGNDEENVDD
ncbi:hypothetical protein MMC07_005754 [Pseudocyphellaria aurata]|nr:hypothetical protein [Pseudocyphellaria aurata]